MYIDFSNYPLSDTYYGGSEKKIGILINNDRFMLKFQKETPFGKRNNHISEYLGSHIFELLGFNTHKTFLGTYKSNNVVACKDFIINGYQFVPFNDVGESSLELDKETYQYSYEDIVELLENNKKLTNVEETVSTFFEIYIVDAFLGNFDRHGANWGFIKENNCYTLAPVFDNGSCLFPNLVDEEEMQKIMESEVETDKRIYNFPTSQVKLNGRKSSYFEVINSLQFEECNDALRYVMSKLDMVKVEKLINEAPFISQVQRAFYKHMLNARYNKILLASFEKLRVRG